LQLLPEITAEYVKDKSCEMLVANTMPGNLVFLLRKNGPMSEAAIAETL